MKRPFFQIHESKDKKPYWTLSGTNGEVLATSETFESVQMCKKGIRAARKAAPFASVRENSQG